MHEVEDRTETMTRTPEFWDTPGYGPKHYTLLHYRQAVRIGDRVEISGQGGWDDDQQFSDAIDAEIVRAFDNVERTLATAGATWDDVYALESWHLGGGPVIPAEHTDVMVAQLRERFGPDRAPIWTQVGVAALGAPGMHVEIRATALIGS